MKTISYWTATIIIAFVLLSGGAADLFRQKDTVGGMLHLGYPIYFVSILGVWKVFGAVALLAPRFPRLKEWAYAGVFFDLTGAAISHAACNDAIWHVIVTLSFAGIALASWALRPPERKLGA
jgi:hypothetical protein